jgi:L-histidine N-alpha-methyltransferase
MVSSPLQRAPSVDAGDGGFRTDVLHGLARPWKAIPAKYLYDAEGSALFDAICEQPEYYLTRCETAILAAGARDIVQQAGTRDALVEFGSGSSIKTRLLLDQRAAPRYVPIDVSEPHIAQACARLACDYPWLDIAPVIADFTALDEVPALGNGARQLGFFPGSTIGNLTPSEAVQFLGGARRLLGDDGALLIGVDRAKDSAILDAAYNDAAGVTARFSLNLLARINRELDGTFDLARFRHVAFYNPRESRIEIYLESLADQVVSVAGSVVRFREGERIHTEFSYKYERPAFLAIAARAGWPRAQSWTDAAQSFDVHLLTPA